MNYTEFQEKIGFHDAEIHELVIVKSEFGWDVKFKMGKMDCLYNVCFGHIDYLLVCGLGMVANEKLIIDVQSSSVNETMKHDLNLPNDGFAHNIKLSGGSGLLIVSSCLEISECS